MTLACPPDRASLMSDLQTNFVDLERVNQYVDVGPPAFTPGHGGLLQMIGILLGEVMPGDGRLLVVGAGGGLETRYLAGVEPNGSFVGVDPASAMLDLARSIAGPAAGNRLSLIEGTVLDAPPGPFDGATCILVLGLIPDDGSKLSTLKEVRRRLKPDAPLILVNQCIDLAAFDASRRLNRYATYALRSGVASDTVVKARAAVGASTSMVPEARNSALLDEAGFRDAELFYSGMAWRGWIAYA